MGIKKTLGLFSMFLVLGAAQEWSSARAATTISTINSWARNTFTAAGGTERHNLTQEEFKKAELKIQIALDKLVEKGIIGSNEPLNPVIKPDLAKEESISSDQFVLHFRSLAYDQEQLILAARERNAGRVQAEQLRLAEVRLAQLRIARANAIDAAEKVRARQAAQGGRNLTSSELAELRAELAAQNNLNLAMAEYDARFGARRAESTDVPANNAAAANPAVGNPAPPPTGAGNNNPPANTGDNRGPAIVNRPTIGAIGKAAQGTEKMPTEKAVVNPPSGPKQPTVTPRIATPPSPGPKAAPGGNSAPKGKEIAIPKTLPKDSKDNKPGDKAKTTVK